MACIADAYFGRYKTVLIAAFMECLASLNSSLLIIHLYNWIILMIMCTYIYDINKFSKKSEKMIKEKSIKKVN